MKALEALFPELSITSLLLYSHNLRRQIIFVVARVREPIAPEFSCLRQFAEDLVDLYYINLDTTSCLFSSNLISRKRRREMEAATNDRVDSEATRLWRIVTDYPDIFDSLIVPKLNGNDVKFFFRNLSSVNHIQNMFNEATVICEVVKEK